MTPRLSHEFTFCANIVYYIVILYPQPFTILLLISVVPSKTLKPSFWEQNSGGECHPYLLLCYKVAERSEASAAS